MNRGKVSSRWGILAKVIPTTEGFKEKVILPWRDQGNRILAKVILQPLERHRDILKILSSHAHKDIGRDAKEVYQPDLSFKKDISREVSFWIVQRDISLRFPFLTGYQQTVSIRYRMSTKDILSWGVYSISKEFREGLLDISTARYFYNVPKTVLHTYTSPQPILFNATVSFILQLQCIFTNWYVLIWL